MTKKDYLLIAKVLNSFVGRYVGGELTLHRQSSTYPNASNMLEALADELGKENPRFDREKFMRACGVEDSIYANIKEPKGKSQKCECYNEKHTEQEIKHCICDCHVEELR